jgi:hypothetical protein
MTPVLTLGLSLDWWLMPLSGAGVHHLPDRLVWHARSMVAAWAVLLPVGVLAARYFKVTPRQDWPRVLDNRIWWHAHRGLQYLGMALTFVGTSLAWNQGAQAGALAAWHHWLGWSVVALGAGQLISAWARGSKGGPTAPSMRGDHYDMTAHRRWFERLHKGLGWLALALAVVVIATGLVTADAPRWMAGVLVSWWLLLAGLTWRWQRQGRCIDTYQAIWGPDPRHPGNRMPATSWGTRRPFDGSSPSGSSN